MPETSDYHKVLLWVETHISHGNQDPIANYAMARPDEVAAVIQSNFQKKEELLLALTMRK